MANRAHDYAVAVKATVVPGKLVSDSIGGT